MILGTIRFNQESESDNNKHVERKKNTMVNMFNRGKIDRQVLINAIFLGVKHDVEEIPDESKGEQLEMVIFNPSKSKLKRVTETFGFDEQEERCKISYVPGLE